MARGQLIRSTVATTVGAVRGLRDLDAPTPCAEYDVRALVEHMLTWGPALAGAGRKVVVPPGEDVRVGDDWAAGLEAVLDDVAAAWSDDGAWQGTTHMGGPMEMPADLVGGMVLGEVLVHGWDLGRASGQRPEWDDDVLEFALDEVAKTADQGRAMGMYSAEVVVPDGASTVDRLLGLTGRDPRWKP
ncbi:TIGR03086 family metal-binding protein [Umezawaea sp. Da 62-37]|uniref:TIGR03086 family metal-binding protein n=1 Tax=Umezawaea sp. Da 62-37 TaxID=3075927 RepID=UPI0028F6DAE8|nr:TIGR03086 family metal-binding protein [Umezawaea sp. Da 62-37]WNV88602.1 TIGR03086 family metal-binding protein [Umezawaea sp. Da 62-37]